MTKRALTPASTFILTTAIASQMVTPYLQAGSRDGSNVEAAAARERTRREEYIRLGTASIEAGDKAMKNKDYEEAFKQYRLAADRIPNAPNTSRLYSHAIHGVCDSGCALAEQRIAEGRYGDADAILRKVLADYDPKCHRGITILAHLEEPDYYNKTIGPKFRARVEEVKQMFIEARGFLDSGRYDLAYKRCEQILSLDPYNIAARKLEEEINRKREDYAIKGYDQTRSFALWQVQKAWDRPVRRFDANKGQIIEQTSTTSGLTQKTQRKLDTIIIPKLEFREATIREAIDFLKQKSAQLDVSESDPSKKGVNIVLRLEGNGGGGGSAPAPDAAAPAVGVIPGLAEIPGAAPGAAPAAAGVMPVVNPNEARITVALSNIPLAEALRYVTNLAGLKYKVEQYAVSVVPLATPTDTLITKEWKVPPGFLSSSPSTGGGGDPLAAPAGGAGAAGAGDATKGGSGISKRLEARDYLTASGITFPPGSSAIFLPSSSKLIVKNTQENLDLIDYIVEQSIQGGPVQVEIESKFVEINQNNLKELSFDWLLGAANIPGSGRVFGSGGTSGTSPALSSGDYPFNNPNGSPVGTQPVTSGLRNGNLAISQNAIDALLFGVAGTSAIAPATAALSGVFTDPQFQLVVRALNQKKGIDLLSAPRVTAKSGQKATIEIIREFRYPTEFEPPQIPQSVGSNGNGNGGGGIGGVTVNIPQSLPVTPTTPTAFDTRNTGVTLEVEPQVGPDGYTIDLSLVPQVVEFEGFINYGSPIQTSSVNPFTGLNTTSILTPNIINQPIFSTRKVQTNVSIFDGQTVVLGGLIREDVQKVEDKIPLLGDIPLIGRLFRSSVEQHMKRNLVIFVSARLINPGGEPIHSTEEEEEIVETLPVPEAPPQALQLPLMPK